MNQQLPENVRIIKQCDFTIQFVFQHVPEEERDAKAEADAAKEATAEGADAAAEGDAATDATTTTP
jgi:hypothetical protein